MTETTIWQESEVFAGLSPDCLTRLAALGRVDRRAKGDVLFGRGALATHFSVLCAGQVELVFPVTILNVQHAIPIEEAMPGDLISWSALVPPYRLTLTGQCVKDSELICFERDDITKFFAAEQDARATFMQNLVGVVGHRLHHLQTMLVAELEKSIIGKLG